MDRSRFIRDCNAWAETGTPFLFVIDYEMEHFHLVKTGQAAAADVFFKVGNRSNAAALTGSSGVTKSDSENAVEGPGRSGTGEAAGQTYYSAGNTRPTIPAGGKEADKTTAGKNRGKPTTDKLMAGFRFELSPVPFNQYEQAFSLVQKNILHGNSFLLNLTFPTTIDTDLSLEDIFLHSQAPYKLYFQDRFVLFSPETFVRIREDQIFSYPMKGTIDAAVPKAEEVLMNNEKERWEHSTIVDLIRNDLSMVAKDVEVTRYRYIDRVKTHKNELLQVSSEIRGRLDRDWRSRLGDTLLQLLPAGSISGAPKKKTTEIIAAAEGKKRGYFTGIFGIFDGKTLDSGVMIRYIERIKGGLQFRSGGGITGHSDARMEYNEMIDKVYVPLV